MSASELFSARKQLARELENANYLPSEASVISGSFSADALSFIAELGLELA